MKRHSCNSAVRNTGYGVIHLFAFWVLAFKIDVSMGKEISAESVDDNELLYFADVFTLKWNIMMQLKLCTTITVICIPLPEMFMF